MYIIIILCRALLFSHGNMHASSDSTMHGIYLDTRRARLHDSHKQEDAKKHKHHNADPERSRADMKGVFFIFHGQCCTRVRQTSLCHHSFDV